MRSDMFKVIIERPRWNSSSRYYNDTKTDNLLQSGDIDRIEEEIPTGRQGMHKLRRLRHKVSEKSLSENLRPLEKYLRKQVGRPWDDVWSEISQNIDSRTTVQDHVRTHAKQYVEKVWREDGKLWEMGYFGPREFTGGLYVDPDTGILEYRSPPKRKRWVNPDRIPHKFISISEIVYYDKESNAWYIARFKKQKSMILFKEDEQKNKHYYYYYYNPMHRREIYTPVAPRKEFEPLKVYDRYMGVEIRNPNYGPDWYCYEKKQLSKKEMKQYRVHEIT